MKRFIPGLVIVVGSALLSQSALAQFRTDVEANEEVTAQAGEAPVKITLQQALEIALSENVAVKVADKEIERTGYARKGTYASLFPQIDASGSFQRTIKKQVMYMDFDMGSFGGGSMGDGSDGTESGAELSTAKASSSGGGIEVGRWNTFSAGISAGLPLVNATLWKSISLSGDEVELAVEKARSSRLDMVTQVKQAYYAVLLSKEALDVYKNVYDNALANYEKTEKRYNVQKASELELVRAKASVANAIPNVFNAESSVVLALWQLKAVMGVDLDENIDVEGELSDYADTMFRDIHENDDFSLENNTTMRQLAIQAEELAKTVQMKKYAYIPTLSASFSFMYNAMTNDFKFSEYKWTPYSFVGFSLSIPIFSGGKRYNDVRQSKVQLSEFKLQQQDTERKLKIGIRSNLNTMETNMKSYVAALDAVKTASKAYEIAEKSYSLGRSTLTDLNDAQLALTQAQLSVSQSIYNFVVAKSSLEQTIGADFIDAEGNVDLNASINR